MVILLIFFLGEENFCHKKNKTFKMTKEKKLPKICLNMIVKNEAHIIKETFDTIVKYIDYWVISDTGSTDGTQKLIKEYFKEKQIPGKLFEDKWEGFGHNRSLALKECEGLAQYAWVIDADDLIVGDLKLPKKMTADGYMLTYGKGHTYRRTQIYKISSGWYYKGVLHEYPECKKKGAYIHPIIGDYYIDSRRLGDRSKNPDKYLKDALVFEKELAKPEEKNNSRYVFYCAQSYRDYAGQKISEKDPEAAKEYFFNSIEKYEQRTEMGGYQEEIFYSLFQIAKMKETLEFEKKDITEAYIKCFKSLPTRSEPLFYLSKYLEKVGDKQIAIKFMEKAASITYPLEHHLFVEEYIYYYLAKFELAMMLKKAGEEKDDDLLKEKGNNILKEILTSDKLTEDQKNAIHHEIRTNLILKWIKQNPRITSVNTDQVLTEVQTDYVFFQGQDSYGGDIGLLKEADLDNMLKFCEEHPECVGFNTLGYMKRTIDQPKDFIKPALFKPQDGLIVNLKRYLESPTSLPGWEFYPQKDYHGSDLSNNTKLTLKELAEEAEKHKGCVAFNTKGYLKSYVDKEKLMDMGKYAWGKSEGIFISTERYQEQEDLLALT